MRAAAWRWRKWTDRRWTRARSRCVTTVSRTRSSWSWDRPAGPRSLVRRRPSKRSSELPDDLAAGRRELRAVRLLLEGRARDALRAVLFDDRGDGEVVDAEAAVVGEMLRQRRVRAVR